MNSNNNGIGGRSIRVQKPRHSETMPGAAVPVLGIRVRDASLSVRWRHPPFPFCSCFPTPLFTLSLLPLPPPSTNKHERNAGAKLGAKRNRPKPNVSAARSAEHRRFGLPNPEPTHANFIFPARCSYLGLWRGRCKQ